MQKSKNFKGMNILIGLSLCFGCQGIPYLNQVPNENFITYVSSSDNTDVPVGYGKINVSFHFNGLKTTAFNASEITGANISIQGANITIPITKKVDKSTSLILPYGSNYIIKALALKSGNEQIKGYEIGKCFDLNTPSTQISISWKTTPIAKAMEIVQKTRKDIKINVDALEKLVENKFNDVHPSRLDSNIIANAIIENNGNLTSIPDKAVTSINNKVENIVIDAQGGDKVIIQSLDPASKPIEYILPFDYNVSSPLNFNISNIAWGETWDVKINLIKNNSTSVTNLTSSRVTENSIKAELTMKIDSIMKIENQLVAVDNKALLVREEVQLVAIKEVQLVQKIDMVKLAVIEEKALVETIPIEIKGVSFGTSQGTVYSEGQPLSIDNWTDSNITAQLPLTKDGAYAVSVFDKNGCGVVGTFTYGLIQIFPRKEVLQLLK